MRRDAGFLRRPRRSLRGFSLLEIMVAMAILGLALSVILSAQGGLSASNRSAANLGSAESLARCKMTEIEEKTTKLGYPELDQIDQEVSCCDGADREGFTCDTRVEKVVLPDPPQNSLGDGGALIGAPSASTDAFGNALNNPAGGPGLNLNVDAGGGLASMGTSLQQQFGGVDGVFGMVMGIVYPQIKPLMEASIRRVTVQVKWKEGPNDRELTIVQYVTQPQRGGFIQGGGDGGLPGLPSGPVGPGSPTGAPPTTPTSLIPGAH
jgi:general secretion pathway protein I